MAIPTVTYIPQKFTGKTSSLDFNTFTKNAMNDISTLYKSIATQESEIDEYYKIMSLQQIYLQKQYNILYARYSNLNNMLVNYSNTSPQSTNVYINYYDNNNISWGGFPSYATIVNKCDVDTQYGLLLPHLYSTQSRIYLYDDITQQSFLPETVDNYKITAKGEGIVRVKDQSYNNCTMKPLRYAFDGQSDTYWYIQGQYSGSSVDSMEIMIDLPLPIDVISTLNCNNILIEPFPAFATEIVGVYYTIDNKSSVIGDAINNTNGNGISKFISQYNTNWNQITVNTPILYQIRNTDTKVVFPTMPVTGIRIHLRTTTYTIENGLRTFIIGVRNIDCNYSQYSPGTALTKITIGDKCFKNVIDPKKTNDASNIGYRLFYDFGTGDITSARFGGTLPAGIKTIYIETAMPEATSLYGLNVQYSVY